MNQYQYTSTTSHIGPCDHKYTHTTIRVAVRDDGRGEQQSIDIQFYCLICGKTSAVNTASRLTSWQTALRQTLPELDRLMADFGIPAELALDA